MTSDWGDASSLGIATYVGDTWQLPGTYVAIT